VDSPARIVRAGNWWASKLPPLIGLALALAVVFPLSFERTVEVIVAVILVTGGAVGAYGHLLNDAFDLEADRRAGRPNRLSRVAAPVRFLMVAAALGLAFLPAVVVHYGPLVLGLLVLECALPALYSIPPLRLKDRGLWGVVADAAGAHAVPTLIVIAAAVGPGMGEHPVVIGCAIVWAVAVGLEGILWHQLRDREDDRAAGATTLAVRHGARRVRHVLVAILQPVKATALVALVVSLQPAAPVLAGALAVVLGLDVVKWGLGWRYVYASGDPLLERAYLPLVSNAFAELWLPVGLAVDAAGEDPRFLFVAAGVLLVFHRSLVSQIRETGALVRDVAGRMSRAIPAGRPVAPSDPPEDDPPQGWRLECHGGAAGHLDQGERHRLTVVAPGSIGWHLKLTRPALRLAAGAFYELRFEIAAEDRRTATICVVRDAEPWDNLGLSERLDVGPARRSVWLCFTATATADAKLDLLLGGASVGITVTEASLSRRYDPGEGGGP
jgi:4-hydroxybenzoate polyprenyltransferase